MPVKRGKWKPGIDLKRSNRWTCPTCDEGKLLLRKDTFHEEASVYDRKVRRHEDWEPDWLKTPFIAMMQCNNSSCKEIVCVSGHIEFSYDPPYYEETGDPYPATYYPKFIEPPLRIVRIPRLVPDEIRKEIESAFSLYWHDKAACVNRIRKTLELFLDCQKAPKKRKTKKGGFEMLTLHKRIERWGEVQKDSVLEDFLKAAKWIGNEGSHTNDIEADDVFDAFDFLEQILVTAYDEHIKELRKKAKKIIKKRKPLGRKKR